MDKENKKRLAKILVGGVAYVAAVVKSERIIKERITKKPNIDIAVKLSSTFWAICYILYDYYYVGEKEE